MLRAVDYGDVLPTAPAILGERTLRTGCTGADVLVLAELLIEQGYLAPPAQDIYAQTILTAVRALQKAAGLAVDGIYGPKSHTALMRIKNASPIPAPDQAEVLSQSVNLRSGPGMQYASISIVHKGDALPLVDTAGWQSVLYNGQIAYISKKHINL